MEADRTPHDRIPTVKPNQKDAITQLNEMVPLIKVDYQFTQIKEGFICTLLITKDREVFDLYGRQRRKQDAKLEAATRAIAFLNLLFPVVPLALFNRASGLESLYTPVSGFVPSAIYLPYHFKELRTGKIYVYVNKELKNYVVMLSPHSQAELILEPECPLELMNDPIRFTDWSKGAITIAQENYISKRLELL